MDPDTRRLVLFAGGVGIVLVCLIVAAQLVGHRSGTIPVITADSRPIRVKPENPGGMQIDGAENDVFSGGINDSNARLAPAAEIPDPNGIRASAAAAPAKPAGSAAPPVVSPAAGRMAAAAIPAPPADRAPVAVPPAAAAPAVSPAAPPHPPAAVSASHGATVQLAALTTESSAREEWQLLTHRMPDLLNGRQPSFSRIERDGHVFWRVRTSGFADLAQAKAFCEHVRAKGAACTVADF